MKNTRLWLLVLLLATFTALQAQDDENDAVEVAQSTPFKAMSMHLHYLQPDSYDPEIAARVIKMKDRELAQEVALQIKQVMDGKALKVYMSQVPDITRYRDTVTGRQIYVPFPKRLPVVYLEKGKGKKWFYSEETVNAIGALHAQIYPMGSDVLLRNMGGVGEYRIWGLYIWQLLSILIMVVLAFLAHQILQRILNPIVGLLAKSRFGKGHVDPDLLKKVTRMLSMVLLVYFMTLWLPALLLPIDMAAFASMALNIVLGVFLIFLALKTLDLVMHSLRQIAKSTANTMDDQFMPIIYRALQVGIYIFGAIYLLGLLSIDATALIAGVSIGGLAIALAAQDTVKNLIGSFMIFVDKPFVVGDFINAGEVVGTVEEVGFRSTRIRAIDTSIFSIPNGKLADLVVNNMGLRVARRYRIELGVTYDTPPDLIDIYIDGLKKLIEAHPDSDEERTMVCLNNLGASSINIVVSTYFLVGTYPDEMKAIETMLRGILRLTNDLGVRFAFPSQALYIEDFPEKKTLVPSYDSKRADLIATSERVLNDFKKELAGRVSKN